MSRFDVEAGRFKTPVGFFTPAPGTFAANLETDTFLIQEPRRFANPHPGRFGIQEANRFSVEPGRFTIEPGRFGAEEGRFGEEEGRFGW